MSAALMPPDAVAAPPPDFGAAAGVSRETIERLAIYAAQLVRWQKAINLVGPATLAVLWQRHMLDSAQLLRHLPDAPGPVVDLGSGAGFPGLVLAIAGVPDVHLVESDARKSAFLAETARLTDAKVTLHTRRIDAVAPFAARAVTARALAPLDKLMGLAAPFFGEATVGLFHKGRDWRRELTLAEEAWRMQSRCLASVVDPESVILRVEKVSPVTPG